MKYLYTTGLLTAMLALAGCGVEGNPAGAQGGHDEAVEEQVAIGPHDGRLLVEGDFALELAIFETGVPPEFRAWATDEGEIVPPEAVKLEVTLTRLGDVTDKIDFRVQEDFLRGDSVIYEPHSFVVDVAAHYGGASYRWQYDSIEGRTHIAPDVAAAFGVETEIAGPRTLHNTVSSYGRIQVDPQRIRSLAARYPGTIESVAVVVGDEVQQGQSLATVRSNDSLTTYAIAAPINGVVTKRSGNPGEQTPNGGIFELMDATSLWVELAIFPTHIGEVKKGAPVVIATQDGTVRRSGVIDYIEPVTRSDQSVTARVTLDNSDGALFPGMFVRGEIEVDSFDVALAVKRIGLQSFRDFTVVYVQIGDEFEVRMLELGREDSEWVEVLEGLEPGARYVTTNSYLVKADIEKSGASHDH